MTALLGFPRCLQCTRESAALMSDVAPVMEQADNIMRNLSAGMKIKRKVLNKYM